MKANLLSLLSLIALALLATSVSATPFVACVTTTTTVELTVVTNESSMVGISSHEFIPFEMRDKMLTDSKGLRHSAKIQITPGQENVFYIVAKNATTGDESIPVIITCP